MFGKEVKYSFYRCTGWPLVSAGLGGYLPPIEMLKEARLMPCEIEQENFYRMLKEVVPFMKEEIRHFFQKVDRRNLHEYSYREMIDSIDERTDEFLSRIESKSKAFMDSFGNS